jgi:hypothetical protein
MQSRLAGASLCSNNTHRRNLVRTAGGDRPWLLRVRSMVLNVDLERLFEQVLDIITPLSPSFNFPLACRLKQYL